VVCIHQSVNILVSKSIYEHNIEDYLLPGDLYHEVVAEQHQ